MANPVTLAHLDIYRYSTYTHIFDVVDVNGEAIQNLNTYTGILEIRDGQGETVRHTATDGNGQLVLNADSSVHLIIPGLLLGVWDFDQSEYDAFVIAPSGNPYAIARGKVRVYPNRTVPT